MFLFVSFLIHVYAKSWIVCVRWFVMFSLHLKSINHPSHSLWLLAERQRNKFVQLRMFHIHGFTGDSHNIRNWIRGIFHPLNICHDEGCGDREQIYYTRGPFAVWACLDGQIEWWMYVTHRHRYPNRCAFEHFETTSLVADCAPVNWENLWIVPKNNEQKTTYSYLRQCASMLTNTYTLFQNRVIE